MSLLLSLSLFTLTPGALGRCGCVWCRNLSKSFRMGDCASDHHFMRRKRTHLCRAMVGYFLGGVSGKLTRVAYVWCWCIFRRRVCYSCSIYERHSNVNNWACDPVLQNELNLCAAPSLVCACFRPQRPAVWRHCGV